MDRLVGGMTRQFNFCLTFAKASPKPRSDRVVRPHRVPEYDRLPERIEVLLNCCISCTVAE
jgi:hypothetical protein